jgi:hypothetical protein
MPFKAMTGTMRSLKITDVFFCSLPSIVQAGILLLTACDLKQAISRPYMSPHA